MERLGIPPWRGAVGHPSGVPSAQSFKVMRRNGGRTQVSAHLLMLDLRAEGEIERTIILSCYCVHIDNNRSYKKYETDPSQFSCSKRLRFGG